MLMKIKTRYYLHMLAELMSVPLKIIPVKNNRIIFISHRGGSQYSDSPMYISEYLNETGKYEIIWIVNDTDAFHYLKDQNIKTVKYRSLKEIYYSNSSKVLVTNMFGFPPYVQAKKNQLRINTMHGGGAYKALLSSKSNAVDVGKYDYLFASHNINKCNLCLSGCRATSEQVYRKELGYRGKILERGLPRNDAILSPDPELIRRVKEEFRIRDKAVLVMPTWKHDNNTRNIDIDYRRLVSDLHDQYGGDWQVLLRLHHLSKIDISDYLEKYKDIVQDATYYPNAQDLLSAADLLITDYSSVIWDFALKNGPILIYATDMEDYIKERGFVIPPDRWGLSVARNEDELSDNIRSHTLKELKENSQKHLQIYGSFEKGDATRTVCRYIEKFTDRKRTRRRRYEKCSDI